MMFLLKSKMHVNPFCNVYRPTMADDLKVGFFSLDRATQTEESEIIDLKEMTEIIQQLLKVIIKV